MANDDFIRNIYVNDRTALLGMVLRETGGDRHLAEDLVQETILRAWLHADTLDHTRSLRPWLTTVARRIAIDGRRSRAARPIEVPDDALEHLPSTDDLDQVLTSMIIRHALQRLPPDHREVILEIYFREHTADEAAHGLGIPRGTVWSRTHYAIRALRKVLREPD